MSFKSSLKNIKNGTLNLCSKGLGIYIAAKTLPVKPNSYAFNQASYAFNQAADFFSATSISPSSTNILSFATAGIVSMVLPVLTYTFTKKCFNLVASSIDQEYSFYIEDPKAYKQDEATINKMYA